MRESVQFEMEFGDLDSGGVVLLKAESDLEFDGDYDRLVINDLVRAGLLDLGKRVELMIRQTASAEIAG